MAVWREALLAQAVLNGRTRGQLLFEWAHFGRKLRARDPGWYARRHRGLSPTPHPIFRIVAGGVRPWERGSG